MVVVKSQTRKTPNQSEMQNVTKYNIVLVKQRFGNINYGSTTVYSYVDIDFQQNVRI